MIFINVSDKTHVTYASYETHMSHGICTTDNAFSRSSMTSATRPAPV